jgi:molecular chaperone DnaK (HSP70)
MGYWLGIDVGTTFTTAGIWREEAERRALPAMILLRACSSAVSAVIYVGRDGQVVAGEAAERRAVTNPQRVVREFKRRIGDEVSLLNGGVPHCAPEIAAMVLRCGVDLVAQREGEAAAGTVITHPVSRAYTLQVVAGALRAARLTEITFCTASEAAAAIYALAERGKSGTTIALHDLGGGDLRRGPGPQDRCRRVLRAEPALGKW